MSEGESPHTWSQSLAKDLPESSTTRGSSSSVCQSRTQIAPPRYGLVFLKRKIRLGEKETKTGLFSAFLRNSHFRLFP